MSPLVVVFREKGALAMTTLTTKKTSPENKRLRSCDYFAITLSCSTMLAKYAASTGLVCT